MASASVPMVAPFAAQRTLQPGMRVRIGTHLVTIRKFLSRGGFAQVYLVEADVPVPIPGHAHPESTLVLKHMCVWNREALATVRAEVEHHRQLRGHEPIVHFVEASAASLAGDGWEIFILMEFCPGGGLIDYLNGRLQHRLQEDEVLTIFRSVCEGVRVMHHLDPILVHRDIKIENVLLTASNPPRFKLCDFGSCFPVLTRRPAKSAEELRRVENELNQHTTMQYRAPEMIDLGMHVAITEKADIWALGVFLYKLCYYTTPFEGPGAGPPAILQARYEFPSTPAYSSDLRMLIQSMLQVHADARPDVDTILVRVQDLLAQTGMSSAQAVSKVSTTSPPASTPVRRAQPPPPQSKSGQRSQPPPAASPRSTPTRSKWRHSGVPHPVTASSSSETPAQAHAARSSHRPDSLILNVSLDDVAARYPSLEEFQNERTSQRSVRSMVQDMNRRASPPGAVSISMEKSASDSHRVRPDHTLVDVDMSSSDEDEPPEDVNARIRPASLRADRVQDTMSPADSVHALLQEKAKDERDAQPGPDAAPEQDELAALAEHEKALRQLLGEKSDASEKAQKSKVAPPLKKKPASLSSASSRRQSMAVPVGRLVSITDDDAPTPSVTDEAPGKEIEPKTYETQESKEQKGVLPATPEAPDEAQTSEMPPPPPTPISETRKMFEQAAIASKESLPEPKRKSLGLSRADLRRAQTQRSSTWDLAQPIEPKKVLIDQGTSPGYPSTPTKEEPPIAGLHTGTPAAMPQTHGAKSPPATVSKVEVAANVGAAIANQRDGRVRLSKPPRQPPQTVPHQRRSIPLPGMKSETKSFMSPEPPREAGEEEQPFRGVGALINKWQTPS